MAYKEILFSVEEPVGFLTLNNPEKINALSLRMVQEIKDALATVSTNEAVKVLIIRANGKHFCAGHYLAEMVDGDAKAYKTVFDQCTEMMQMIHDIPQPVIAQVQGIATAAGCQMVAWCDLAIAEEGAKFATPGVRIGLFCTTPMVAISRAIGRKAAMEMLLTGRYFSADEAKDVGLINRVVPADNLAETTEQLAGEIADASGFVLGIGKQAFYKQIDQPDRKAFEFATHTMVMNNMAEDAQNGIKAFLNKGKVEWRNR